MTTATASGLAASGNMLLYNTKFHETTNGVQPHDQSIATPRQATKQLETFRILGTSKIGQQNERGAIELSHFKAVFYSHISTCQGAC